MDTAREEKLAEEELAELDEEEALFPDTEPDTDEVPDPFADEDSRAHISDSIHQYLNEIGQIQLMDAEEERETARRCQEGDAAAKEKMINANLRLVVAIARDYMNHGLSMQDRPSETEFNCVVDYIRPTSSNSSTISFSGGAVTRETTTMAIRARMKAGSSS